VLVFTNLPALPLLTIGGCCLGLAWTVRKNQTTAANKQLQDAQQKEVAAQKTEEKIEDFLTIDAMEMEIGVGLIRLANPKWGGDLLSRITSVRQTVASEIGIILPKVRIRDNISLQENQYRIKIFNNPVAEGTVYPDQLLAVDSGMATGDLNGIDTEDPAFGQPAKWIDPSLRDQAFLLKYTPVEPAAVLATHLQEVVRRNAEDILTRDATKDLLDQVKKSSPAVVDELAGAALAVVDLGQQRMKLFHYAVQRGGGEVGLHGVGFAGGQARREAGARLGDPTIDIPVDFFLPGPREDAFRLGADETAGFERAAADIAGHGEFGIDCGVGIAAEGQEADAGGKARLAFAAPDSVGRGESFAGCSTASVERIDGDAGLEPVGAARGAGGRG
jgi:hypothetical protein